jgi:hypothetical protein
VNDKTIRSIFWALVAVFVIIIGTMFVGAPLAGNFQLGFIAFPSGIVFLGLGVTLIVLTIKKKVGGKPKKFLLLTGSSAVGLPLFAILSNLVYALFIYFFGENFWGTGGDEPFFFILATIVCPISFLVGTIGTIVLTAKNKPGVTEGTPQGGGVDNVK